MKRYIWESRSDGYVICDSQQGHRVVATCEEVGDAELITHLLNVADEVRRETATADRT